MRLPLDAVMFIKPLGQTVLQKKNVETTYYSL